MELENVRNLIPDLVCSLFEDSNVYAYFDELAKRVINDESGVDTDLYPNETWIYEPYAYVLAKLASPRILTSDETYYTRVEANFKRAIEVLKRRANTVAVTGTPNPLRTGIVE